jgi:gliding motility-associated-like protein
VTIYNRWGEKVFESNDIDFGWDGRYRGEFVSAGIYVYKMHIVFLDDHTEQNLQGGITITR